MEDALKGEPETAFKPPKGVTGVYIDPETGYSSGPGCAAKHYTYFVKGTEPANVCYGQNPQNKQKTGFHPKKSPLPRKSGGTNGWGDIIENNPAPRRPGYSYGSFIIDGRMLDNRAEQSVLG